MAAAVTDKTVAWLVDCGMPNKFAIRSAMATENRIIETTVKLIISGANNPLPIVVAVPFPAMMAPRKTIIPNNPGMRLFLIILAPYAAEKAGAVPLPPILIARNMAIMNGINR